ncbi:MAG: hypothetical protein HYV32_06525 [Candidatus Kerfeldbacteria bacterium]|nr:hypothetical protein [Candidatus Kerfeldbacteria bacterium]
MQKIPAALPYPGIPAHPFSHPAKPEQIPSENALPNVPQVFPGAYPAIPRNVPQA